MTFLPIADQISLNLSFDIRLLWSYIQGREQQVPRILLNSGWKISLFSLILTFFCSYPALHAQEKPYFVTYSHDLEEPGNLEFETKTALAQPEGGNHYGALATEFEYGVRAWWT